jgi:hypothetical protein
MSIESHFGPDSARLTMAGPLTPAVVLDMRREFRTAIEYYRYERIEIEIHSPGGDVHALRALVIEMQWLRSNGCVIATTAILEAGSAAALTLSMGDVGFRTVQQYTNLLFHHARVMQHGERHMTAINANAAAQQLHRLDVQFVGMLVSHLRSARGGPQALAMAGLERCKALQLKADTVAQELGPEASISANFAQKGRSGAGKDAWFKSTVAAYQSVLKSGSAKAFTSLLAAFFALDDRMPLEMAWCLQLIDSVEGSTVLKPEVTLINAQPPKAEASNSPSMRLAA